MWVVERLTKQRLDAEAEHPPGRRDAKYLEATDVPARLRSRLAHYKHSGFDRGHLARPDHRGSKDVQCRRGVSIASMASWGEASTYTPSSNVSRRSTFYLDNMAPQDSLLNRGPWLRLRKCNCVVSVARVADEVYVVSGPLFLPEREKDGLRMTTVSWGVRRPPRVLYLGADGVFFPQVVLAERGGVLYVGCFVLPNGKCDDDLSKWLVPLENLEAASGV